MKKKVLILLIILLFPITVFGETCDNSKISILEVTKINSEGNTEEISSPSINNQQINTNLKLYDIGDSITYRIRIKNNSNEDYTIRKDIMNDENIEYSIITDNYKISSGDEKTIELKILYKSKIDNSKYENGKYIQNKDINLILNDSIVNPNTGIGNIIMIFGLMLLFIILSFIFIKSDLKYTSLLVLLFIPLLVQASCQYSINIKSNIEFNKLIPNPCTYDGELIQGAEYVNGQYTYRYMQEQTVIIDEEEKEYQWIDINQGDGWGVTITDHNSSQIINTKLCSSINGKPIISMKAMFEGVNTTSLDLSNFDTSNVNSMQGMFADSNLENIDLSSFDTSNVTDMAGMFYNCQATSIDLSSFDNSKVEEDNYMFCNVDRENINFGPKFNNPFKASLYDCFSPSETAVGCFQCSAECPQACEELADS